MFALIASVSGRATDLALHACYVSQREGHRPCALCLLPQSAGGPQPGGGVTHVFGRTGMCRSNGSLFYKKSLNMGPVFYQKILKHGLTFLTEPKFLGFRMAKTPKIAKFLKNGPNFQEKSLKMGTLFCQNHP